MKRLSKKISALHVAKRSTKKGRKAAHKTLHQKKALVKA